MIVHTPICIHCEKTIGRKLLDFHYRTKRIGCNYIFKFRQIKSFSLTNTKECRIFIVHWSNQYTIIILR